MNIPKKIASSLVLASLLVTGLAQADYEFGTPFLISQYSGASGNADSSRASLSGEWVVFSSASSNLVDTDANASEDLFLWNTESREIEKITIGDNGSDMLGTATNPVFARDGGIIAFESTSSNLTNNDTNGYQDIYVYNTTDSSFRQVTRKGSGTQANAASYNPSISDDGRYVVYETLSSNLGSGDTNGHRDVYIMDLNNLTNTRLSIGVGEFEPNGESANARISGTGDRIVFDSAATNLVSDDTNGYRDVFYRSQDSLQMTRISLGEGGMEANGDSYEPVISEDGTHIAFFSDADNLFGYDENDSTDIFLYDTLDQTITHVGTGDSNLSMSADGNFIAYLSGSDAYLYDVYNDETSSLGSEVESLTLSDDGMNAVWGWDADGSVQLYWTDLTEATEEPEDDEEDEDEAPTNDSDDSDECEHSFTDISGHWAEETLCFLAEDGVIQGVSTGIFSPDTEVTRAEFVKIILLDAGYTITEPTEESPFSDVTEDAWYFDYVLYAEKLGLVSGYADGTFKPNQSINRAEAVAIVVRMMGEASFTSENPFSDVRLSDWFSEEVLWAAEEGIVEGYSNGTFRPANNITRAEAATIAYRSSSWEPSEIED